MKIFVLHYSKLIDRKKCIIEQFQKNNITNYEFVENYDKDDLTSDEINMFIDNYRKPTMSLFLKHIYVFRQIAEKYENALIFEDDVILSHNFIDKFNNYYNQLPDDYDMLFIGNGCNLHIESHKILPNINIYEKCLNETDWGGNGCTRCSDSYVINKKCAIKLINSLKYKIDLQIDFWLNMAARYNNLKVYWAEPTIVTQGSQNGTYNSTIQHL